MYWNKICLKIYKELLVKSNATSWLLVATINKESSPYCSALESIQYISKRQINSIYFYFFRRRNEI